MELELENEPGFLVAVPFAPSSVLVPSSEYVTLLGSQTGDARPCAEYDRAISWGSLCGIEVSTASDDEEDEGPAGSFLESLEHV